MATKYLYSGAAGLNDGSSWANAWVALSSATGLAAGDELLVHKTHSQTGLTTTHSFNNGTIANPVKIICVDKDAGDVLATGASFAWTAGNVGLTGNVKWYGVTITGNTTGNLIVSTGNSQTNGLGEFENCTFTETNTGGVSFGSSSAIRSRIRFLNCTFDWSGATAAGTLIVLGSNAACIFEFTGCTFTPRATQTSLFSVASGSLSVALFRGCTFSGTVTNLFGTVSTVGWQVIFDGCTLPTYTNIRSAAVAHICGQWEIRNCVGGTISAAVVGPAKIDDYAGTIAADLTRYRDGGASDGVSSYCLAMVTNANAGAPYGYLASPPIIRRVNAGASQTITAYIASGGSLNNDEVYAELLSPSEAGTATPTSRFQSSRVVNRGTPAALTTDGTSTWTGTGVGTLQKITFTISPTVAGLVVLRLFVAKASATVYFSPELGVS